MYQDTQYYPWGQFWQVDGGWPTGIFGGLYSMQCQFAPCPDQSQNRDYPPTLSRWMVPDPGNAGANPSDPQTWNMYAYAGNNPTTNVDPDGEDYYLIGGDYCNQSGVTCDQQGYVLDSNGSRQVVTDQQIQNGDVPYTLGPNGVATINGFQAQFFDNTPYTIGINSAPGSVAAALATNFVLGTWNAAMTTVIPIAALRPSFMQTIPAGTGVAAGAGQLLAMLLPALVAGEDEVPLTEHALERALQRGISRGEISEAVRTAKAAGDVITQAGKYGTPQQVFTGKNNVVVVVETVGQNAGKAITVWRK